jgi:aldehyde dehydrogenase (NAD+)
MTETTEQTILQGLEMQRAFFKSHETKSIDFRIKQLRKLKEAIFQNQKKIEAALWSDLHKSPEESYLTEISLVTSEIDLHIKHLKKWAKPKRVSTPFQLWPSRSTIMQEPLGVSLIISPWNYPFQLVMNPLVGAISAGCCSILKPSPDAPTIAKLIGEMISQTFDPEYITTMQGGRETTTMLLKQRFDMIFFTGSTAVGKVVMKAAAEHLTPVLLELGGKSPCIVDESANIELAAKRIAWGKLINAGQTCVAPDYLYVHESVKEKLLNEIAENVKSMYGDDPKKSMFYPRIIHERALQRLSDLASQSQAVDGGEMGTNDLYLEPTLIDKVLESDPIMQEEIFGPILPVLTFNDLDKTIAYINNQEKPLAFYYFGKESKGKLVLEKVASGSACINDCVIQFANHHLPFGGVGNSGMGKYHGKASFTAFSNTKAVMLSPTWIDLPLKYAPFKYFGLIKKII